MSLEEAAKLHANESVIAQYNCGFPAKREELIEKIGKKRFLLVFEREYKYKEIVDARITMAGTLYLTNRKIYFVKSEGLIFKKKELILDIPYEEIVSTLTQGVIFKDLVIGTEKDGVVKNYTFSGLPAKEVMKKIKKIQEMKEEELKPKEKQVSVLKVTEKPTAKKSTQQTDKLPTKDLTKNTQKDTANISHCANCGYKIFTGNNFCAGCGSPSPQNFAGPILSKITKRINEKIGPVTQSTLKIKLVEGALKRKTHYCANCGKLTKDAEKFCTHCGQNKNNLKKVKFCKNCGNAFNEGDKFCSSCSIKR